MVILLPSNCTPASCSLQCCSLILTLSWSLCMMPSEHLVPESILRVHVFTSRAKLSLAGNSDHLIQVQHCSHKSSTTHSYQRLWYFRVSKHDTGMAATVWHFLTSEFRIFNIQHQNHIKMHKSVNNISPTCTHTYVHTHTLTHTTCTD